MKKVVLILLVVLLAGCSSNEDSLSKVEEFEMKLACGKMKEVFDERSEYLNDQYSSGWVTEVFYSSKENTCMYLTESRHDLTDLDGSYKFRNEYTLRDGLKGVIVLSKAGCDGSESSCGDVPKYLDVKYEFYDLVQEYR